MSGLARCDAQKRNSDLARLIVLIHVRAQLLGPRYRSPLKYPALQRHNDPHVDHEVSRFLNRLTPTQLKDPRRLQRAASKYLNDERVRKGVQP